MCKSADISIEKNREDDEVVGNPVSNVELYHSLTVFELDEAIVFLTSWQGFKDKPI